MLERPPAAVAFILTCFALPFALAALLNGDPDRRPTAVPKPTVTTLRDTAEDVRVAALSPMPSLPPLRPAASEPGATTQAPAPAGPTGDATR